MKFTLLTQKPKAVALGLGVLSVDRDGCAYFFDGDGGADSRLLAEMKRARIEFAAAHGIMLSGMEPKGCDRKGRELFTYQEWWLVYPDNLQKQ